MVTLPGQHQTIMAGLNCGATSPVAWPDLLAGLHACVAIEDEWARQAMRELASAGVVAGETGASGLAGLLALLRAPGADARREQLGLDSQARVLVIVTEGATDPVAYERIVKGGGQ